MSESNSKNRCAVLNKGFCHFRGLFGDDSGKHTEIDMDNENQHKMELDELNCKIAEIEEDTQHDEWKQLDELNKLELLVEQAEGKLRAAEQQYVQCIEDVREQYEIERQGYCVELQNLENALKDDTVEKDQKVAEVGKLEEQKNASDSKSAIEKEQLISQIQDLLGQIWDNDKEHEAKLNDQAEATKEEVEAYMEDKQKLKESIMDIRGEGNKMEKEFRQQQTALLRERMAIAFQTQSDRKEMELRFGPLILEKEDMEKRIKFLEDKIDMRKEDERRRCADIVKKYDDMVQDRAQDFERDKADTDRILEEKNTELIEKEMELIKVREAHDAKIREINQRIDVRAKEMERQIFAQNDQHNKQLEAVCDQSRHKHLEDEIHTRRISIMNLEKDQEAEETLLLAKLKQLADKERNLREALGQRNLKQSDSMTTLDAQLGAAKIKVSEEQRIVENLKDKLNQEVQNAKMAMAAEIRDIILQYNETVNQVCDITRLIKDTEDIVEHECETKAKRADDEIRRLGNNQGDLKEMIPPLQDKHNELKQKIKDDKHRHDVYMKNLRAEQAVVQKEHDDELARLYGLLDNTRKEHKKELDHMAHIVNKIQNSNHILSKKHENEMFDLNMKLVQAFEGPEGKQAYDKLKDLKKLQEEHSRQISELDKLQTNNLVEEHSRDSKFDSQERSLQSCVYQKKKDLMKDGISDPERRKKKLDQLVKKKKDDFGRHSAKSSSALELAKSKNEELRIKITHKKKDLQELRTSRQKEIAEISKNISDTKHGKTGTEYNYATNIIQCVLDDISSVAEQTDQTDDGDESNSETATSSATLL